MGKLRPAISPDKKTAVLQSDDGQAPVMDSAAVEDLIWDLMGCRENMYPPRHQGDPLPGTRVAVAERMRWWIQPGGLPDSVELAVMHPGLGWLAVPLQGEGIDRFVEEIGKQRRLSPLVK
jgi:hypothetical protein